MAFNSSLEVDEGVHLLPVEVDEDVPAQVLVEVDEGVLAQVLVEVDEGVRNCVHLLDQPCNVPAQLLTIADHLHVIKVEFNFF